MKRLFFSLFVFLIGAHALLAQPEPVAYRLYTGAGKPVKFSQLVKAAAASDATFFGELHNNAVGHWLQQELARAIYARKGTLALGMEMFETDQQGDLESYLSGFIAPDSLGEVTRLWPNYETDYQPLVEFMRAKALPVYATNAPQSLARMVFRKGPEALDTLNTSDRRWLTPLPLTVPYENPSYQAMLGMTHGSAGNGPDPRRMVAAQALKDATMAHRIHILRQAGQPFLHLNGSYHSDKYEGILWYLRRLQNNLKLLTLTTVEAEDPTRFPAAARGVADFVLVVHSRMTHTYE